MAHRKNAAARKRIRQDKARKQQQRKIRLKSRRRRKVRDRQRLEYLAQALNRRDYDTAAALIEWARRRQMTWSKLGSLTLARLRQLSTPARLNELLETCQAVEGRAGELIQQVLLKDLWDRTDFEANANLPRWVVITDGSWDKGEFGAGAVLLDAGKPVVWAMSQGRCDTSGEAEHVARQLGLQLVVSYGLPLELVRYLSDNTQTVDRFPQTDKASRDQVDLADAIARAARTGESLPHAVRPVPQLVMTIRVPEEAPEAGAAVAER